MGARGRETRLKSTLCLAFLVGTAALLAWFALTLAACDGEASQGERYDGLVEAEVVRVVDGDTLILNVNGDNERVRLIGINCPESVAQDAKRNTEEGVRASDYTKSLVTRGDTVWLETDTNDRDQYDRLLRYVWLERPNDVDDRAEIASKMLNGLLVRDGYAQAHRYGEDDKHIDVLRDLGREAIEDERGVTYVWG